MVNRMTMKKAVQFGTNESVETIEVECWKEHTSVLWWTRREVREIEDESETLIHFMNIHMNNTNTSTGSYNDWNQYPIEIDATIHSIRGLEKRTEIGAWDVYELQRDARNAVLNQQDKHRQSKSLSLDIHEAIAKAYRASSMNARRTAYEVGLKDQLKANRCHGVESIAPTRTQQHQQHAPVVRQSSKTIILTSEPICTKPRRTSSVLLPTSKDSITSSPATSEKKMLVDVTVFNNTSERIGMAPRLGFDFTPIKKRPSTNVLETSVITEPPDDVTTHVDSPRRKKLTDLIIDLNLLQIQPPQQEQATTEGCENILVAPISRKKTVRKKKVDGSVVLDENVLQALQDNGTVVIKKKKKKKSSSSGEKRKGDARPKRKSPKRSTSRDSSHGNTTTDTEQTFDMSCSSSMSINTDELFQLDEFNGESHHGNVCYSNSCVFENSQPSITSLHDSFITI